MLIFPSTTEKWFSSALPCDSALSLSFSAMVPITNPNQILSMDFHTAMPKLPWDPEIAMLDIMLVLLNLQAISFYVF